MKFNLKPIHLVLGVVAVLLLCNLGMTVREYMSNPTECPSGSNKIGDGSACRDSSGKECALRGNPKLERCYSCPTGYSVVGDGSACRDSAGKECGLWGNETLARCSSITKTPTHTTAPTHATTPTPTHTSKPSASHPTTCPSGYNKVGDGSACRDSAGKECALWGNETLERCFSEDPMPSAGPSAAPSAPKSSPSTAPSKHPSTTPVTPVTPQQPSTPVTHVTPASNVQQSVSNVAQPSTSSINNLTNALSRLLGGQTSQGVKRSDIPVGDEHLYILKSEIVPPVCPKCPDVQACPKQKKCNPCPPCARCPDPAFTCKKVPYYTASTSGDGQTLPLPVLNDFSAF